MNNQFTCNNKNIKINKNNKINEGFVTFGGYSPNDYDQTINAFTGILKETALKVGCCNRKSDDNSAQFATVRVPIDMTNPKVVAENKYEYKFETIKIPPNTCPADVYADSYICNAFYDVYCQNIFDAFSKTNLDQSELINYAPECACYIPNTKEQSFYPAGTPPSCYKKGCSLADSKAYLDTVSRNVPCNLKICQNLISINNIKASGNVVIDPVLQNTCGEYMNQPFVLSETNSVPKNIPSSQSSSITGYFIVACILLTCCLCAFYMKKKK